MIKQLITDIKGKYLSENSACGYSYSKHRYQNTMAIVDAMLKKGVSPDYYYGILNHEIATLDELTKGSHAEQDLCAEFQVLSKTLSLYNYKKAMKVELQALDNELRALKNELQAKYYQKYNCNGDVDVVSKSYYDDCSQVGVLENCVEIGVAVAAELAIIYALCKVAGPFSQFVDSTFDSIGSAITEFAATIDFPSFVSI